MPQIRDELLRRWTEDGLESTERAISRARWSHLEKALLKARKDKKVRAASCANMTMTRFNCLPITGASEPRWYNMPG